MFTNVWYSHPVLLSWAYSGSNVFSQVIFDDVRNREWDSLQSESEICLKWVWKSFWISAKRCCGWAQLYNFCLKLWTDFQIILLISETFTCQIVNRYLPLIHCIQEVCTCWSHEISLNFIPTMMWHSGLRAEPEQLLLYWTWAGMSLLTKDTGSQSNRRVSRCNSNTVSNVCPRSSHELLSTLWS